MPVRGLARMLSGRTSLWVWTRCESIYLLRPRINRTHSCCRCFMLCTYRKACHPRRMTARMEGGDSHTPTNAPNKGAPHRPTAAKIDNKGRLSHAQPGSARTLPPKRTAKSARRYPFGSTLDGRLFGT